MTSGLETERVYSGFGASKICHLLTKTLTHLLKAPDPHGTPHIPKMFCKTCTEGHH